MQKHQLSEIVAEFTDRHMAVADQLLPLLHRIQTQCGAIPDDAVAIVAEALNIAKAEVAGVISFYADFHIGDVRPSDQLDVEVCCAEACQSLGADHLHRELAGDPGINARKVYCLGNCAAAPSVRIGSMILARADAGSVNQLKAAQPSSGS
jgi:formate dehydrogenase subunit gamma